VWIEYALASGGGGEGIRTVMNDTGPAERINSGNGQGGLRGRRALETAGGKGRGGLGVLRKALKGERRKGAREELKEI